MTLICDVETQVGVIGRRIAQERDRSIVSGQGSREFDHASDASQNWRTKGDWLHISRRCSRSCRADRNVRATQAGAESRQLTKLASHDAVIHGRKLRMCSVGQNLGKNFVLKKSPSSAEPLLASIKAWKELRRFSFTTQSAGVP